jgi:ribosome-associated toxin RatA of RatAB toxin-antitoxin module
MSVSGEQEFSAEIDASVDQCFATITDFEQYPNWFSSIKKARVLERYPDGLAKRIEFFLDLKLKMLRYVLEYRYDQPTHLTWKAVDGDVEAVDGEYRLEKLKPRLTRATCRQAVALGFWVPGPIRKLIERQALQQSVLEFKAASEAATMKRPARLRTKKR